MKHGLMFVISFPIAWMILSCASQQQIQPSTKALQGDWRFVYGKETMAPPKFDLLQFKNEKDVVLISSLSHEKFDGVYSLTNNTLQWKFQPPKLSSPVEHTLTSYLKLDGQALVLCFEGSEFTYFKPEILLSDDLVGRWVSIGKDGFEMVLDKDGGCKIADGRVSGVYRLFHSNYGKTLTMIVWIQGEGGFVKYSLFKRDGDLLMLTPIGNQGPEKENQITCKLAKS